MDQPTFLLSDDQKELRSAVRKMCEERIAPFAAAVDRDASFPWEGFKACVEMELTGLGIPSAYGGSGADHVTQAMVVEEIAKACGSTSLALLISKLAMIPVMNWGTEEQKTRYLPRIASGEAQGSYCLSEADAGSDAAGMRCRAVKDGDHYVLNGTKYWITNAGVSDIYTVFAKTDPDGGSRGISCFIVEAEWGVKVAKLESKMGMRGSPTGEVVFEDVHVPVENRLGQEGEGFKIAMHTLDRSRPTIGAQAVGLAQAAIDAASAYLKERKAFGHAIADFQGLRFMIAEMAMRTEAARALVYKACSLIDAGDPDGDLSMIGAMAKCFASDTAMSVTTDGVQLFGGYGFTTDFPAERFMRDTKVTQIYEGTNQIQRVVIAKRLLG
ncbi:MAG: acyl-CoA dehydrogenase family protein [Acidimicrobiales bacterium]